jgi:K+-sensing histidine kinase KdpD
MGVEDLTIDDGQGDQNGRRAKSRLFLRCMRSGGMTAKAIADVVGVPSSQVVANQGTHCNGHTSGARRHRAPAAVAFVHDGTVIDVDINGGIELSAYRENEGVASNRPPELDGGQGDFCATLLAMASHDLRQPLQVIIGAVDVLAQRLQDPGERSQLARVERATARLASKLEQLVEALHLRESATGDHHEPVKLDRALEELASELVEAVRVRGIGFRVVTTGACVLSHPVLLSGMMRNLIRNAIDYTPRGGRVLVACRRRGTQVHIEVYDNGVGIPPEQLGQVFTAFHRVDATRSDGLGLGLFIVKRAADFLGHRLEVRSALGRGSCFAIVANAVAWPHNPHLNGAREGA